MKELKKILLEEIKEFNEFGHKFVNGEITRNEFKAVSGGMGVYSHRDGENFMIRLRMPSGVSSKDKLEKVYELASEYNLQRVHLTTRQAIQLHGLNIDEICEIMKEALKNDIYTRGGGGNYPRNVAASPLSGVDEEEAFDIIPYALTVNNHFMKKINTYKLPRKLKVAFANSNKDSANCSVTDMGFLAVNSDGKMYFKLFLGGGLGRNPAKAVEYDELVEPTKVLYHIEAMTKLFINEGDYENKGRARIRYIVERMGKDEFIKCYKSYLNKEMENSNLDITVVDREYKKEGIVTQIENNRLFKQKQKGLYSVYVHPIGGQLSIKDFRILLDELKNIEDSEIRLAMTEGFYIINLNGKEAGKMLEVTKNMGGSTKLEQSVACIGVPTCQIGVLNSQGTLKEIIKLFKEKGMIKDILPRVHISGCPNSCGTHEIGEIGLMGKMKKVDGQSQNVFELHMDGSAEAENARIGKYFGDLLQEKVPEFLYELAELINKDNAEFYKWINENEVKFKELINKFSV